MKLLSFLIFLPLLYSFSFSPMSQSIDLGAKQKSAQFLITNDGPESIAVELTVKERVMDSGGMETLPDTKEMAVFPPQLIIPAKEKRTVRLNWSGSKDLKTEKAFRVVAEQLPLKVDEKTKKKSGIQMLMRYMAALYVTPEKAEPKISVTSYEAKNDVLVLTVENSGDRHHVLTGPILTFEGKGKKVVFDEKELPGLVGENVLANSQRIFKIKNAKEVPAGAKVSIKFDD